jgi:hypothetical protein
MSGGNGVYQEEVELHGLGVLCAAAATKADEDTMFRSHVKGCRGSGLPAPFVISAIFYSRFSEPSIE